MGTRQRPGLPSIWVTWIAKLLGGELECQWSAWFRARHYYDKYEEMAGDLTKWNADHSRLMRKKAAELEKLGYVVATETENKFSIAGKVAEVGGKPDLVAVTGPAMTARGVPAHSIVVDGKTGRRKQADWWQVLIYLYFFPQHRKTPELSGEVYYAQGEPHVIEATELTEARKQDIVAMIKTIAADTPPKKTPSREECKRCNIGPGDCPERVQAQRRQAAVATSDF